MSGNNKRKETEEDPMFEQDLLADHPMTTIDEGQVEWDAQEGELNSEALKRILAEQGILPDESDEDQSSSESIPEGTDPVVDKLRSLGLEVTRENYLALAYPDCPDDYQLQAEEEAMLPISLQIKSG